MSDIPGYDLAEMIRALEAELDPSIQNNTTTIMAAGLASALTYILFYTDTVPQLAGNLIPESVTLEGGDVSLT